MKKYYTIDKSAWMNGPWKKEPDKLSWTDKKTGFPCLIKRNWAGVLCGYVGVDEPHPAFKKDYDHDLLKEIRVHGGLTYADKCQEGPEENSICHIPALGKKDHIWWFGFDCHHLYDFAPGYQKEIDKITKINTNYAKYTNAYIGRFGDIEIYRNLIYVKSQVKKLAKQLYALNGLI
jgi:hypothetical protein